MLPLRQAEGSHPSYVALKPFDCGKAPGTPSTRCFGRLSLLFGSLHGVIFFSMGRAVKMLSRFAEHPPGSTKQTPQTSIIVVLHIINTLILVERPKTMHPLLGHDCSNMFLRDF